MSVRFQKTPRGEVAILPRKDYEALVSRLRRLMKMPVQRVWLQERAMRLPAARRCYRKTLWIGWPMESIPFASCENGATSRRCISPSKQI